MIKHTFAKKGVDNYEVCISTVEGNHFEGDICEKCFHMDVYSNNIFAMKLSNILKNIDKAYENMSRDNLINQETFSWGHSLIKSIVADCTIKNLVFNSSLLNNL